jgi:predicted TIM-barrel fold metal-dependent hydrolase
MIQDISQKLADMRANPQTKQQILDQMKARMTARGISDADSKLAEVGKILDRVGAISDADFEKSRQDLVLQAVKAIRGGTGPGGPALGPGGGGKAAGGESTDRPRPDGAERTTSGGAGGTVTGSTGAIAWVDVHNHLIPDRQDFSGAVAAALAAMNQAGVSRMLVLPTPASHTRTAAVGRPAPPDCESFVAAIRAHPTRFAFLGGGATLNVMVQQASEQTTVTAAMRRDFEKRASEIVKQGAVGFGEIAAHHLSLHGADHPYESVPADHPLLLLLADIAAKHDVVIDIHLDAVTDEIQKPDWLESPPNPKAFKPNIAAFERLLDHNPKARICWAHAGSDNLGQWTTDLSRRLLRQHLNLYMSLRMGPGHCPENYPLSRDGRIKPEWLSLLQEYPSRFVIGNDRFVASPDTKGSGVGARLATMGGSGSPPQYRNVQTLLGALPSDLARKIAVDNAVALYRLKD